MEAGERYLACVEALRAFARTTGFTEAVIGLSGGMDSSIVAAMCVDALGAARVHGVLLPGPYSSGHSVEDACALADRLGIEAQTVSICAPYQAFEHALADACGGALTGLAAQNTQARCRMVCLMALSNAYGWMLVNTGNKSEAMMGYSTLYGDTAGAFAPIGGLYKTDVYAVARWRNGHARADGAVPPLPERVFSKPPSAELAPGQDDETSLGVDYPTLDALLVAHVEHGMDAEELAAAGFEASLVERVLDTVRATAFKRALEPPYPNVDFYADHSSGKTFQV
ncbi:MAG: NAD(+) synthase [Gordonibacter sp.]